MKLLVGDVVKINGELKELIVIAPHQDIPGAVYYTFSDGYVERDVRLHPDAVYRRIKMRSKK